jgi:hypothetical protein
MVAGFIDRRTVCDLDKEDPRWTVENLTQNIVRGSEFPGDWLFWPPDVFALTSLIFKQTGCYRCVSSDKWPLDPEWQDHVERAAKEWLEQVNRVLVEGWTYPASVDTSLSRGVLFFQSNLLELSGAHVP